MIIPETDVDAVFSGVTTLGGADLVIRPTPTGLYKVVSLGAGAPPKITEETFTTLPHAKRALADFERLNAPKARKKEIQLAAIERRKAAYELKNGGLTDTVNGESANN